MTKYGVILASASPARAQVLKTAGIDVIALPSSVDEDLMLEKFKNVSYAEQVEHLSHAKATDIAQKLRLHHPAVSGKLNEFTSEQDLIIIACDSMFEFDGKLQGKPKDETEAYANVRNYAGKSGILHTGHTVILLKSSSKIVQKSKTISTTVHFAQYDAATAKAYVKTGEPMGVAGSFKIDARGSALINGVDGDYYSVVGISPNCIYDLLREIGVDYTQLW